MDIHQPSYIWTILVKFRMDESRPVATPMAMKLQKRKRDKDACNLTILQSMIGDLLYAMTATWPDIAYAIGVLSRYTHDARKGHMVAPKNMFRYVKGPKDWRLCSGGALGGDGVDTHGWYLDSDYAGSLHDYQSTSGMVTTYGGAVNCRSRKHKSTAQATTDAEY
jgi:hypothetical protein